VGAGERRVGTTINKGYLIKHLLALINYNFGTYELTHL
jgi:hypothetical protein